MTKRFLEIDETTANFPLFDFGPDRKTFSKRKFQFRWMSCEMFAACANGIPSGFDMSLFRAISAARYSWLGDTLSKSAFSVKKSVILDMMRISGSGENYSAMRESANRLSDTGYVLRMPGLERSFRLFDRADFSSSAIEVSFAGLPAFWKRTAIADWEEYLKLKKAPARRIYEFILLRLSMKDTSPVLLDELSWIIPLWSGRMNRKYIAGYLAEISEIRPEWWMEESGGEYRFFVMSKRAAPANIPNDGVSIDTIIPKTDIFLRKALLEAYWYKCFYTREPIDMKTLSVDHIVPESRGGRNCISNYVPVTITANSSKNDRYDETDSRDLLAVVRAVYARKVLEKYVSIRSSFYSAPIRA